MFSGLVTTPSIEVVGKLVICIMFLFLLQNLLALLIQHMSFELHTLFQHLPFMKRRIYWVHPKSPAMRLMMMKTGDSIMFLCKHSILIRFSVVSFCNRFVDRDMFMKYRGGGVGHSIT